MLSRLSCIQLRYNAFRRYKAVLHIVSHVPCWGDLPERHGDATKRP